MEHENGKFLDSDDESLSHSQVIVNSCFWKYLIKLRFNFKHDNENENRRKWIKNAQISFCGLCLVLGLTFVYFAYLVKWVDLIMINGKQFCLKHAQLWHAKWHFLLWSSQANLIKKLDRLRAAARLWRHFQRCQRHETCGHLSPGWLDRSTELKGVAALSVPNDVCLWHQCDWCRFEPWVLELGQFGVS